MTNKTANDILAMIEAVDPDNIRGMHEINRRVAQFLGLTDRVLEYIADFTRSRDALKAIRPEGWEALTIQKNKYGRFFATLLSGGDREGFHAAGATEELAELHAIIQAIEFEGGKE